MMQKSIQEMQPSVAASESLYFTFTKFFFVFNSCVLLSNFCTCAIVPSQGGGCACGCTS